MQDTAETTIIPSIPRPANTTLRVIQMSPAGDAVVGELNASKTTLRAMKSFAMKVKASRPAKQEQVK